MEKKDKVTLEVQGVSIEFPGVKALSDVDFSIETGEIRAIPGLSSTTESRWT